MYRLKWVICGLLVLCLAQVSSAQVEFKVEPADVNDAEGDLKLKFMAAGDYPKVVPLDQMMDSAVIWEKMEKNLRDAGFEPEELERIRGALDMSLEEAPVEFNSASGVLHIRTDDGIRKIQVMPDGSGPENINYFMELGDSLKDLNVEVFKDLSSDLKDLKITFPEMNFGYMIGVDAEEEDGKVKVISVVPDTPAAKAGIQSGGIVWSVNNIPVYTVEELNEQVQKAGAENQLLRIEVRNDTATHVFNVTPTKREIVALDFNKIIRSTPGAGPVFFSNAGSPIPIEVPFPTETIQSMNEQFEQMNKQMQEMQNQMLKMQQRMEKMQPR